MFRKLRRPIAYLQLFIIAASTGCTPLQPYFANERGQLAHYLDAATAIEYPEVDQPVADEVRNSKAPLSLHNHDYEYWDLTLEDCINITLHNTKILRTIGGALDQRQNVPAQILSTPQAGLNSVYDLAITASTTQSFPLAVDSAGNRTLPRGAIRSNQVGGVEDALAEFDAQVSSFLAYNTTDQARNVNPLLFANTSPALVRGWDGQQQLAVSKRTATGGVATLRQQTLYSRNNTPTGQNGGRAVPSDWTVIMEAQVQHPLMRNRGALVNRIPVVLASINEDITLAQFEDRVRNLVKDVENAYWDLYLAYQIVETEKAGRDSSQVTARFARTNFERGNATEQDVAQAEGQYFSFEGRAKASLGGSNVPGSNDPLGVYGRERDLRFKMGLEATDGRLIRPVTPPTVAPVKFDWMEVMTEATYRSPELRQQKYEIKQAELEFISAKNQLLPDLDLSFLYRWRGTGDELASMDRVAPNFPAAGSNALNELTEGDFQESAVRLEFTPPAFGARRELARVSNARWRKVFAESALETKEAALANLLSDAISKLVTHYELMSTSYNNVQAAEREVQGRLAEHEAGRSDINVLLQSQLRRAQAQLDYYRALVEYNKSVSQVHYLKGTLLDYNAISLKEGPWGEKAYWDALERARERDASRYINYGWTRPNVQRVGPVPQGTGADAPHGNGGFFSTSSEPVPQGSPTPADIEGADDQPAPEGAEANNAAPESARQPIGTGVIRTSMSQRG